MLLTIVSFFLCRRNKKCSLVVLSAVLLLPVFAQPVISSFAPASGPAGTLVTIKGRNFDAGGNNIVFFGAARAAVLTATDTTLLVTVPLGATYMPVTVTSNRLTGYSAERFVVTFPGARASFSPGAFAELANYPTGSYGTSCSLVDLDGDGKPDMVANNGGTSRLISLYQNISTPSKIKFGQRQDLLSYRTGVIEVGDLNGDGRYDIVVADFNYNRLYLFENASEPGIFRFTGVSVTANYEIGANGVAIGDLDGDGKPEIAATDANNWKVSVYKNTSTDGNMSFEPRIDFPGGMQPYGIVMEDLDGDGKKDIIIDYFLDYKITVYKNISTGIGNINFAAAVDFATPYAPGGVATGDLDMDGKPDVVTANTYANSITVFKNTSVPGTISFATRVDYVTGATPNAVVITDLDGDGLPDVAVSNTTPAIVSVYKNTSTFDNLVLAPKVDYDNVAQPFDLAIADIDGDGRPDMATANDFYYRCTTLRNRQGESIWKTLCPPAASVTFAANTTGTSYQWQIDTGDGFSALVNDSFYNGVATANLQLINVPSSWYGYRYRCLVDNDSTQSDMWELRFSATWTGAADNFWENPLNWSCNAVPDSHTDVIMKRNRDCYITADINIRSLYVEPRQGMLVDPGVKVTINH